MSICGFARQVLESETHLCEESTDQYSVEVVKDWPKQCQVSSIHSNHSLKDSHQMIMSFTIIT